MLLLLTCYKDLRSCLRVCRREIFHYLVDNGYGDYVVACRGTDVRIRPGHMTWAYDLIARLLVKTCRFIDGMQHNITLMLKVVILDDYS